MIVLCLADGPRRFSELSVPLRGITATVLTRSVRALERDGFVTRTAYPGTPRRVEYTLTPLGHSLLGPLEVWRAWAEEHLDEVLDAREATTPRSPGDLPTDRPTGCPERSDRPDVPGLSTDAPSGPRSVASSA
ncbi:MAG TPA: helix-turn-helix domain-containing protein [Actinopolymorphaceae bacterium]